MHPNKMRGRHSCLRYQRLRDYESTLNIALDT